MLIPDTFDNILMEDEDIVSFDLHVYNLYELELTRRLGAR